MEDPRELEPKLEDKEIESKAEEAEEKEESPEAPQEPEVSEEEAPGE